MKINTIEDTFFLSKIGRGEWEGSGNGTGIHVTTNHKLIGGHWHSRVHSLLLLGGGNFRKNHGRTEIVFNFMLDKI